jgi:7-keto-8-aminopelargonate synthetase-like enzyme
MDRLDKLPGRAAIINGREYLYFSGTSYLGMADNAAFLSLLREGLDRYQGHYGGSRLGKIHLGIFEEAEHFLSRFTGAAAALIVSSGSLAGQLLMKYLPGPFYFAPGVHPALLNGQQPFNGTFEEWKQWLLNNLSPSAQPAVLVANAIDPLGLHRYTFDWLEELLTRVEHLQLLIDDSHGLGVSGISGQGIYGSLPTAAGLESIVVSSLGKALGVPGGVVLANESTIKGLWRSPFFGGASPPSPAFLHALVGSGPLYREALMHLRENINYFHALMPREHGFRFLPEYPVFSTTEAALSERLKAEGVLISQLSYPTPDSPLITRIVLSAAHTQTDIERLCELL